MFCDQYNASFRPDSLIQVPSIQEILADAGLMRTMSLWLAEVSHHYDNDDISQTVPSLDRVLTLMALSLGCHRERNGGHKALEEREDALIIQCGKRLDLFHSRNHTQNCIQNLPQGQKKELEQQEQDYVDLRKIQLYAFVSQSVLSFPLIISVGGSGLASSKTGPRD